MTSNEVNQKLDAELRATSWTLLAAFLVGILFILVRFIRLLYAVSAGAGVTTGVVTGELSVSLEWGIAWLAGGFLFGFLFGIPKVLQPAATPAPTPAPASPRQAPQSTIKPNTNLEEISDWLTKILVGATLTQLVKIPAAIARTATFMANGDLNTAATSFAAAVLVYFSALGFLAGYLLTRLYISRIFDWAGGGGVDLSGLAGVDLGGPGSPPSAPPNPTVLAEAKASQEIPLTSDLSATEALGLAKGAAMSGDMGRSLAASKLAIEKDPDDPNARLTFASALTSLGGNWARSGSLAVLQEAAARTSSTTNKNLLAQVYTSLSYMLLYERSPDGFERALATAAEYDEKGGLPNASIEINRACGYGQQYAYLLKSSSKDDPAVTAAREGALAAVKKALALDPGSASLFKQLLWVTGLPEENDLAAFQTDQDFVKLLPK